LVGLAALDGLAVLGVPDIAVGKAMLVTILRVVLQRPLGLLKAPPPSPAFERLAGRRTRSQQRLPSEPKASGCCPKLHLAECLFDVDHHPAAPRCENVGVGPIRTARVFIGVVIGAIGMLSFAGHAHADQPPIYAYSFNGAGANTLGGAAGIAIDNSGGPSTNDLYIADYPDTRVEKFDSSGNFILMFGDEVDQTTGGNICTAASGDECKSGRPAPASGGGPSAFGKPAFVAVDSSNGPSSGDVYVADWETLQVSKFDPDGNPILSWGEDGHLTFPEWSGGIAVGPNGALYVQSGRGLGTIFVYDQNGSPVSSISLKNWSNGDGIGVDGSGNLYVSSSGQGIEKYSPTGSDLGVVDGSEGPEAVALDPSNNNLYATHHGGSITEFSPGCPLPDCAPLAAFGSGYIRMYYTHGIAIDAATHTVFVTNPGPRQDEIAVFYPPGILAEALTLSSRSITDNAAEILGQINPAGASPATSCIFEYVAQSAFSSNEYKYAKTLPCLPRPEYANPTGVSAGLSGLERDTTYHYRVVATNDHGASRGLDQTFTTARALPDVATGSASNFRPTSVTVSGSVTPGSGLPVSACYFQYVTAASFESGRYTNAVVAPCEPRPEYSALTNVDASLEKLESSTTYYYRIIAWDSEGEGKGEDRKFFTTAAPIELKKKEPTELRLTTRVRCTKHACNHLLHSSTRPKTWTSASFPAAYAWQADIFSHGHWLAHSKLIDGCVATFRGNGLVVRLNGCHGHVRVRYVGAGKFTVVWQLYK